MLAKPEGDTATRAHISADVVGPQPNPARVFAFSPSLSVRYAHYDTSERLSPLQTMGPWKMKRLYLWLSPRPTKASMAHGFRYSLEVNGYLNK